MEFCPDYGKDEEGKQYKKYDNGPGECLNFGKSVESFFDD